MFEEFSIATDESMFSGRGIEKFCHAGGIFRCVVGHDEGKEWRGFFGVSDLGKAEQKANEQGEKEMFHGRTPMGLTCLYYIRHVVRLMAAHAVSTDEIKICTAASQAWIQLRCPKLLSILTHYYSPFSKVR